MLVGLIRALPLTAWALAAVALWGGYGHWQAHTARTELADTKTANALATVKAFERYQTESERREGAAERISREAAEARKKFEAKLASDRIDLRTLSHRLRDETDRLAGGYTDAKNSAFAANCAAALATTSELFGACQAEYAEMGADAENEVSSARSRGIECERRYDSLTPGKDEERPW